MREIEDQIKTLRKELKDLEDKYYSGESNVDDDVYDYKLRTLIFLETKYPNFKDKNSPTQKVGFTKNAELNIAHEAPMLSLNNAFTKKDLEIFFDHCEKEGNVKYVLEPKIDGASISITYENKHLKLALSRGDGETGEDLTDKILRIPSIPIYLSKLPDKKITFRGEIYIRKSDFEKIKDSGSKKFANHRNFVSGSLRLKNVEELENKSLRVRVYQLLNPEEYGIYSQMEILNSIKKWGLETHDEAILEGDREKIYAYIESFGNRKNEMDVPCDGLVLKVNDLRLLEDIGFTSKFPKWAIAYKYPSTVKESKLLEIFPTVGRTGKITYSARLEPVELDGSIVQYATLHNANYIKELDLRIGDYAVIYKSGEIVPKIIGFSAEKRTEGLEKFIPTDYCPSCNSKLVVMDKLSTQFCLNDDCLEKKYAQLAHFASRGGADIEGLSTSIVIKFSKLGILNDIDDIYRIKDHKGEILEADLKIKDKLFDKLVTSIEKSKSREFKHLLFGLGINFVGEEVAAIISRKYTDIEDLMNASKEELMAINGVGEKSAESVYSWFRNVKNRNLVISLKDFGLFRCSDAIEVKESILLGKRIVITGKLSLSRENFCNLLEKKYGAIIYKDVNSKTDILVAGEDPGSKLKKAEERGVKVMSEKELMDILNGY